MLLGMLKEVTKGSAGVTAVVRATVSPVRRSDVRVSLAEMCYASKAAGSSSHISWTLEVCLVGTWSFLDTLGQCASQYKARSKSSASRD